jgi:hypothetical protein
MKIVDGNIVEKNGYYFVYPNNFSDYSLFYKNIGNGIPQRFIFKNINTGKLTATKDSLIEKIDPKNNLIVLIICE